jgi:PLD-like domain
MKSDYQVTGANKKAAFTLKIHRGDGMVLLAMNWRNGKPPNDFVGFAIEYKEPDETVLWPLTNRIGFPGQRKKFDDPPVESTRAPFQKFRWVHFPLHAEKQGDFLYRVTPMFMDSSGKLGKGEFQEAAIALMRETIPGKLNIAYTRGFVSSQAFVHHFEKFGKISTLIPERADDGLSFKPTHPKADEALDWMGFEARAAILEVLDEAIKKKAEVRMIAYDFNLPEILSRLVKLGPNLRMIIDDSTKKEKGVVTGHGAVDSPETAAEKKLRKSAGVANVKRQHMAKIQHHKSIAVSGKGISKVIYGSTNISWRGVYVQSNHVAVVDSKTAVDDYFNSFDTYFAAKDASGFSSKAFSKKWFDLGLAKVDAKVAFSPHSENHGKQGEIAKDIARANSVFFSLAFLGQTTKGPVGPAIGAALERNKKFVLGVSDKPVGANNLGLEVVSADGQKRIVKPEALTKDVPPPFSAEPTGLAGTNAFGGTRMHHKFVVLDFETDDARVYFGSFNFSDPADFENGENLVFVKDRTVATSFMVEALRIYDHYRFRTAQKTVPKGKSKIMELALPPKKSSEKTWWDKDWSEPARVRDREIFA